MSNVVITSAGLDFITSAHDNGTLLAIKYFLPVYDYRTDPYIITSPLSISAAASASDVTPFGEIIYNIDTTTYQYSLTPSDDFVIYTADETITSATSTYTITNAPHDKSQSVNLYNNSTLSNYISGTNATYASNQWTVINGTWVAGDNSVPSGRTTGRLKYFGVVDYYPVASGTELRGSFKCRWGEAVGTVKFNKIALYAVQLNPDGTETGTEPVLFAEAMLENPVIKNNFGTEGFDDIVIDVQVKCHSIPADWQNVIYSTSGDYWERTVGGLYYPENIGIGTFNESVEAPQAKLHVMSDNSDTFRLGYDDTNYVDMYTTSGSNLEIKFIANTNSLTPASQSKGQLGSSSKSFKRLYVLSDNGEECINIDSGDILLGGDYGITLLDKQIIFTSAASLDATIIGADIRRIDIPLIIGSQSNIHTGIDTYLISGIKTTSTSYSLAQAVTGDVGPTHKNLVWYVQNNNFSFLDTTSKLYLLTSNIITKANIKLATGYDNFCTIGDTTNQWKNLYIYNIINYKTGDVALYKNLIPIDSEGSIGTDTKKWPFGKFVDLSSEYINATKSLTSPVQGYSDNNSNLVATTGLQTPKITITNPDSDDISTNYSPYSDLIVSPFFSCKDNANTQTNQMAWFTRYGTSFVYLNSPTSTIRTFQRIFTIHNDPNSFLSSKVPIHIYSTSFTLVITSSDTSTRYYYDINSIGYSTVVGSYFNGEDHDNFKVTVNLNITNPSTNPAITSAIAGQTIFASVFIAYGFYVL